MRKSIFTVIFALFLLVFAVVIVQAQAGTATCPAVVEEALANVDTVCDVLDRNSACYGATAVDSTTVVQPRPANFFTAPGDTAQLVELRAIHPQPLDESTRSFGIGLLNLQANLPNTLPGQGVLFMLLGGAQVTNEVAPESSQLSPFQSFIFSPGIGGVNCYEADPMLAIQTPGNISINLTFNGVETEMSPGTLLTITSSVCTIHRGNIIQRVGDETAVLLANQTVDIHIDDAGNVIVDNLRGISEREFERGQQLQTQLNAVAAANGWAEQFVSVPREFDLEMMAGASPSPCDTQHTVVRNETLHRIAKRYDTSVLGIVEANQLSDPRLIHAGLALCIPDPGSGFEALPLGY